MPSLSVLIKPASGLCNMRCKYCFYDDVTDNREVKQYGIMTLETLEQVIRRALEYATRDCTIAFQGGEPTLAGLDFFKAAMEFQKKYNTGKAVIHNAIQTNGYVIDEEWAEFFAKNHFLVGLSLDGTKDTNDHNRIDAEGKGTYQKILHAAQLFQKAGVEYNILTVVTAQTARNIGKIYGFFMRNGFYYQQYIPCLDPLGTQRGGEEYSLTPAVYGKFLKTLFDLWYNDVVRGNFVSIRYFENLVNMLSGYPPESCGMAGICTMQNVIEADGSVYPCDFYVLDQWKVGNVRDDSFAQLVERGMNGEFVALSRQPDPACQECRWFGICRGGCRRDRDTGTDRELALTYFCEAYQEFFAYAMPRLEALARRPGRR